MKTYTHFILKDNIKFHRWEGKINMTQSKLIYLFYWSNIVTEWQIQKYKEKAIC